MTDSLLYSKDMFILPNQPTFTAYDLARMGMEANSNGLYDSACDMLEAATNLALQEEANNETMNWLVDYRPDAAKLRGLTNTAKKVQKSTTGRRSPASRRNLT